MRPFFYLIFASLLATSCIQDAPPNPEADILTFTFSPEYLRVEHPEINNTSVVCYPNFGVDLTDKTFNLTVTPGANWEKINKENGNDTVFYIRVTSEDKNHTKLYAIVQVDEDFPGIFTFENWVQFNPYYFYENPKEKSYQWYSSNNGAAIAFSTKKPNMPANEYPVRQTDGESGKGATLVTMVGPGNVYGDVNVPCMAGSIYLGNFSTLNALKDPLSSTLFGVPFHKGKPVRFKGSYKYKEGTESFIVGPSIDNRSSQPDSCDIYAILFKADSNVKYLDGNTIATSPNRIAKAQLPSDFRVSTANNDFVTFDVPFDYASYSTPYIESELVNNQYKIVIVCTSSSRGAYYQGRPGSTLTVDNISVVCE